MTAIRLRLPKDWTRAIARELVNDDDDDDDDDDDKCLLATDVQTGSL
jgi:hypothetical protein